MGRVPRAAFARPQDQALAYADLALPLGAGATLSQPLVVATMLQALALRGGERVLDIGSGSGYTTALLCELAGSVRAIERVTSLEARARRQLEDMGYANFHSRCGDGRLGEPDHAPYDAILISAATAYLPPPLLDQMAVGGRLVAPLGGKHCQWLSVHSLDQDGFHLLKRLFQVRFVPLVEG